MDIKTIVPQEYYDHLIKGGILVFVATPFDKKLEPLTIAFDRKHIYKAKRLINQSWIHEKPIQNIPDDVSPEDLIGSLVETIMDMSKTIDGAMVDIFICETDKAVNN